MIDFDNDETIIRECGTHHKRKYMQRHLSSKTHKTFIDSGKTRLQHIVTKNCYVHHVGFMFVENI